MNDIKSRLLSLIWDMGSVVSVIERKRDLDSDECAQVVRVKQWQQKLYELEAMLSGGEGVGPVTFTTLTVPSNLPAMPSSLAVCEPGGLLPAPAEPRLQQLQSLENTVRGIWQAFPGIRADIGNTNYAVVQDKLCELAESLPAQAPRGET